MRVLLCSAILRVIFQCITLFLYLVLIHLIVRLLLCFFFFFTSVLFATMRGLCQGCNATVTYYIMFVCCCLFVRSFLGLVYLLAPAISAIERAKMKTRSSPVPLLPPLRAKGGSGVELGGQNGPGAAPGRALPCPRPRCRWLTPVGHGGDMGGQLQHLHRRGLIVAPPCGASVAKARQSQCQRQVGSATSRQPSVSPQSSAQCGVGALPRSGVPFCSRLPLASGPGGLAPAAPAPGPCATGFQSAGPLSSARWPEAQGDRCGRWTALNRWPTPCSARRRAGRGGHGAGGPRRGSLAGQAIAVGGAGSSAGPWRSTQRRWVLPGRSVWSPGRPAT